MVFKRGISRIRNYLSDLLQLFVILHEEGEVHEGNVYVWVTTKLPVFLDCVFSSRECVLVYLAT